jgi:hypothetical protein
MIRNIAGLRCNFLIRDFILKGKCNIPVAGKFFHNVISILPAANRIDGADPQRTTMKPSERSQSACRQQLLRRSEISGGALENVDSGLGFW